MQENYIKILKLYIGSHNMLLIIARVIINSRTMEKHISIGYQLGLL